MALNDLASGEEFLTRLLPELPLTDKLARVLDESGRYSRIKQPALQGFVRYVIRMRAGHLAEAGRTISELAASASLGSTLSLFDARYDGLWTRTQHAFSDDRFSRHITAVRGNLGFHYNHKGGRLLAAALSRRAKQAHLAQSHLVLSHEQSYMRLQVGDDVFDSAYSILLGVDPTESFHERLYDEMEYAELLTEAFSSFALPFIEFYLQRFLRG